jgi:hypothetical protein
MASYPKPTNTGSTFNSSNWVAPTINSADSAYLNANYCQFPTLQGAINTKNLTTTGTIGVSSNIVMNGVAGVNYIEFPDGTKQTTATQDFSGYAFTDVSNNFSKLNTFNGNIVIGGTLNTNYLQFPDGSRQYSAPVDDINTVYNDISNTFVNGTIQTFTGNNNSAGMNSPFVIKNYDNGEGGSLYLDPSGLYDITLYSNQSSNAGLTVRNPTNSFTINPTSGNTATFLNPIACNYSITSNATITGKILKTGYTSIQQDPSNNYQICSFYNSYSGLGGSNPQFYYQLQDPSGTVVCPFQMFYNSIQSNGFLNMNTNYINNLSRLYFTDGTNQTTAYSLPLPAPTGGSYTCTNLTVNGRGQITNVSSNTSVAFKDISNTFTQINTFNAQTNINGVGYYNEDIVIDDNSYQIANTNYVSAFKTFYKQATVAITTGNTFFDVSNTNTSIAMTWLQPNLYIGVGYYYLNTILYPASYIVFFNGTRTSFNMSITPAINFSQSANSNITKTIPAFNNKTLTFISIQISISPTGITFTNSAGFQSANWYTFDLTVINNYLLLGGSP